MKALVTGATGFVGSHIVDYLIEKGFDINCTVRKTSNLRWLEGKPVKTFVSSLGDKDSLAQAAREVDYVVHAAGLTGARNYEEFLRANRDGARNLLEATLENSPKLKRFIFVSSQTVAGPAKSLDKPVTEDMPPNPLTSYGKSKLAAEKEVLKFADKLPVTIVRPPAVFGPRDTAIFPVFQMVGKGVGTLIGLRKKFLNLIYPDDLSEGTFLAMTSKKSIGEIYFIASEEIYNWDQLIELMRLSAGRRFVLKLKMPHFAVLGAGGLSQFFGKFAPKPPVFNFEKAVDFIQDYWICSPQKAVEQLGYRQKISIEEAVDRTIDWYKKNNWMKA